MCEEKESNLKKFMSFLVDLFLFFILVNFLLVYFVRNSYKQALIVSREFTETFVVEVNVDEQWKACCDKALLKNAKNRKSDIYTEELCANKEEVKK